MKNRCVTRITHSLLKLSWKLSLSTVLGLVIISTPVLYVHAENAEDLLNVYDLTLGGPIKSEVEKRMEALEAQLASMEAETDKANQYNAILEVYMATQQEYMHNMQHDIVIYNQRKLNAAEELSDSILTADISTLLELDSKYKSAYNSEMDLLQRFNDFKIDGMYKDVNFDMDGVRLEMEQTHELYIESLDAYELGSVSNVGFILKSKPRVCSYFGYGVDTTGSVRFSNRTAYYATDGEDVYALFNGEVVDVGYSDVVGKYIAIRSGDNVKYMVTHCKSVSVREGDYVKQGDCIGTASSVIELSLYLNGVAYDVNRLFQ